MSARVASLVVSTVLSSVSLPLYADGKHIAVLGGMMKSHHITVVPMIEGLLEKGHKVSFLMPATTEARSYFPKGIGNASMVYLGAQEWSFDKLFSGDDMDIKNKAWPQKIASFAKILWSYRDALDLPMFSMYDELIEWIKQPGIDAVLLHMASLGSIPIVEASGIPFIGYLSFPPAPMFFVHDADAVCRYPNQLKPPRVEDLKSSLMTRVANHMQCRFLQGYMKLAEREIKAIFRNRGTSLPRDDLSKAVTGVPNGIVFGGPPLSLKVPLSPGMHLVGSVERPKPHPIPADMLSWLDAAKDDDVSVVYISLGTKYEFTETTCSQLVKVMYEIVEKLGLRVLWSLRASQQEKLTAYLPKLGASIRIEAFTPQPEVLQHCAVKVFLSHCGWGGITDSIAAGVPILAYPGMSEQFINARGIEETGAGIILREDFSNLFESTQVLLDDPKYGQASKAAGETLRSYGGIERALEIVEAAANGQYLTPDPKVHDMMKDVDPFFSKPQVLEQWISLGLFSIMFLIMLMVPCLCCRCLCKCCGCVRRRSFPVEEAKKKQ